MGDGCRVSRGVSRDAHAVSETRGVEHSMLGAQQQLAAFWHAAHVPCAALARGARSQSKRLSIRPAAHDGVRPVRVPQPANHYLPTALLLTRLLLLNTDPALGSVAWDMCGGGFHFSDNNNFSDNNF